MSVTCAYGLPGVEALLGANKEKKVLKAVRVEREPVVAGEDSAKALVDRAREGDHAAYRELVEQYQHRVYAIALSILGNPEDARDISQEAFLKAYRNLGSFRGQSSFYTWLYRIVFNLSVDLSRRRYRHREVSVGDSLGYERMSADESAPLGHSTNLATDLPGPEEVLDRSELGVGIKEAMDSLSPEHRAVVILREVDGLSYAEISDVVGCSKGTVMSRLYHARKRLQRSLAEFATSRGLRAVEGGGVQENEAF